jgi:hypothetical protein
MVLVENRSDFPTTSLVLETRQIDILYIAIDHVYFLLKKKEVDNIKNTT